MIVYVEIIMKLSWNKGCFFSGLALNVVAMLHTIVKLNLAVNFVYFFCYFNINLMFFSSVNTVTMSRLTTKLFQIAQTIVQFGKPTVHFGRHNRSSESAILRKGLGLRAYKVQPLDYRWKEDCAGSRFQNCSDRAHLWLWRYA